MHPYIHSQLAQARTDDLIRQADRRRRRDNVPRRMPRSNTSHPPAAPFIDRPFRKAPVMTTIRPEGGCDTHDMVVVHRVFRREFTLIPQMARATPAGDTAQAAAVAAHIREMVHMLHHHHRGEDELLWPLLRERAAVDVEVIRQMETPHTAIAAILAPIEDALLATQMGFPVPMSQQELADYAGMTHVHLNCCLKELRESGMLTFGQGWAKVQDWAGLSASPASTRTISTCG